LALALDALLLHVADHTLVHRLVEGRGMLAPLVRMNRA
jgi:hypothetical protein